MVRFYTAGFFDELGRRLSADQRWVRGMKGRPVRIVCSAYDHRASYLIAVEKGHVTTEPASSATSAKFRFEGSYEDWTRLCKGEVEIESLVQSGRIRVTGPMPELVSLFGPLNHIVLTARSFPKEF